MCTADQQPTLLNAPGRDMFGQAATTTAGTGCRGVGTLLAYGVTLTAMIMREFTATGIVDGIGIGAGTAAIISGITKGAETMTAAK